MAPEPTVRLSLRTAMVRPSGDQSAGERTKLVALRSRQHGRLRPWRALHQHLTSHVAAPGPRESVPAGRPHGVRVSARFERQARAELAPQVDRPEIARVLVVELLDGDRALVRGHPRRRAE
jgi:hypothetical protein